MDPILKSKKSKKKQQSEDKFFVYTFMAFGCCSSFPGDTNKYYDEYVDRSHHRRLRNPWTPEVEKENKMRPVEERSVKKGWLGEEHELVLPKEELKKRADDFIARVNRQRWSEARLQL